MLGSYMHRFGCCCDAACIYVCWVAICIDSDVVVKLNAPMYAGLLDA